MRVSKKLITFAPMDEKTTVCLLEEHGIKPTANRIVVARALAESMMPQTLAELENRIMTIDKSNIFRAITLFKEHHLVHAIEGSSEGIRFELCHSHDQEHDEDQHPHFVCERCQKTYCLEHLSMPDITLPPGFDMRSANLIIKGLCPHCKDSE